MKIAINEKQLKLILSKTDMAEEETAPEVTTTTPSSSTSSSSSSYPTVTKWESGVTRGAGNQIGVTKWSDVVGASIKRGKANPLN